MSGTERAEPVTMQARRTRVIAVPWWFVVAAGCCDGLNFARNCNGCQYGTVVDSDHSLRYPCRMETLSAALDVFLKFAQAVALIYAAVKVGRGVEAWRSEYVGKRRTDLAESLLVKFYQVREAVQQARPTPSVATRLAPGTSPKSNRLRAYASFTSLRARIRDAEPFLAEFYALKASFLAHFPQQGVDPFAIVSGAMLSLQHSMSSVEFDRATQEDDPDDVPWLDDLELLEHLRNITRGSPTDSITNSFEHAESILVATLTPHIAGPSTLLEGVRRRLRKVWSSEKTGAVRGA